MIPRPPNTTGLIRRTQRWNADTDQAWSPQPPAAAPGFDPASGFPFNRDDGERFVDPRVVDEPDIAVVFEFVTFDPGAGFPWPVDAELLPRGQTNVDDTVQAWAVQPPAAPPAAPTGPWNADEGERFVTPASWPDPTPDVGILEGPPLNAVSLQAPNQPLDEAIASPAVDDTQQAWAVEPLPVLQVPNQPHDEPAFAPTPDDTTPAWAVQPPLNADRALEFNQPDDAPYAPVQDDTSQALTVQPPAYVPVFQLTEFAVDAGGEVQAQPTDDPSVQAWAVGSPLNAAGAQAFNQPQDAELRGTVDDTAQPYAIAPQGFDPAAGFPWPPADDIVQPTWWAVDDTSQPWAIAPPAESVFPWAQLQGDLVVPAWIRSDDATGVWTATLGVEPTFIGGRPPGAAGIAPAVAGSASHARPAGEATAPTPGGDADHPTPR